ncbi:MAG: TetR/AcrR family transcriptional regulator [Gammaproteobacteria bacterium]|nr:TetR/AcrR family transcriptional regulator [Gammaproteobacteria bacterium]MBT8151991.1 TetR/AcrR family transcriptional regulator [Gammaproteobacteria bacterium]NND40090.1 TetR/AcrR family transcriptional regulator [Pseudomonadales bacterium]NNM11520.1 TetR/AcrR family transcriptional regulator [Pseudomonadales bacterium]RZV59566.1 MAG: TetR/AcrR family transcriptional regulator [Pseudomonadales bacterium]
MSKSADIAALDGRHARSERSKLAIIDAALALIAEGNLIPTAQQISSKAGVGIRSFFRHFEDMETLFATIDDHVRENTENMFLGGDRSGTLDERILHAVERHADGYEDERNLALSTSVQLWHSETLRKNYARYQRGLRKDLDNWLPELKRLTRSEREALDAVASFEMWHRLRYHQGLGKRAAINVVVAIMKSILGA